MVWWNSNRNYCTNGVNFTWTSGCYPDSVKKNSRTFTISEWNQLESSVNFETFKAINSNSCQTCVDGCDDIIKITQGTETHEIRVESDDTLDVIRPLLDQLRGYHDELRN